MVMGKHEERIRWEVGPLEKGISGYLPGSWIQKHNPEINWHTHRVQWRRDCWKKDYIPTAVEVDAIEDWKIFAENHSQVYQICTAVWYDEDG
jgi:hypothetical protein